MQFEPDNIESNPGSAWGSPKAASADSGGDAQQRGETIIHVVTGTAGNDSWTLIQPGYYDIDGLAGVDSIDFGTVLRTDFTLTHLSDGSVRMDSLTGASGAFHATLHNIEVLKFDSGRDTIDLLTFFGDVTPPTIVSLTPASGSVAVAADANLVITFSEAVHLGSGSIVLKSGLGDVVETFDLNHSGNIAFGGNVLTINPSVDFSKNTTYTLEFSADAIEDKAGNPMAASSATFTTASTANHPATGTVTLDGILRQGQVLTALNTLADADGLGKLTYQWLADDHPIAGATSSTFTLTASQVDTAVSVRISYVDALGGVERVDSAHSAAIGGIFNGSDSDEYTNGSAGADIINGYGGNDILSGNGGDDTIDGGAGTDTALYHGLRASYQIAVSDNGALSVSGGDGTDTLQNIERLRFDDVALAFDNKGTGGQAYRLYQAAFNRTPDATGLGFWIHALDSGVSLDTVATGFVNSAELAALYGSNPSNHDLVDNIYRNVLHRTPDAAGEAFWIGVLDAKAATVGQLLAAVSESPENVAALVGVISHGVTYIPYAG
jgi:hypothetical protein